MSAPHKTIPGAMMGDLPWPDAAARIAAGHPIILPIGAAAKAHGPHLPLATDKITVDALSQHLVEALPVLAAPTVGFGFYPAFVEYPASQHISAGLFESLLVSLMKGFIDHGAKRILLLNGGVSTEAPVMIAAHAVYADTGVRPAMAHLRLFGRDADAALDDPTGGHADERETSLMLALRPDLVDLVLAEPAPTEVSETIGARISQPIRLAHGRSPSAGEYSGAGATGDPTKATAEKGGIILQAIMADLIGEIRRVFADAPDMQNISNRGDGE